MSSIEYDIFWYEAIKQLRDENILSDQECSMWFNNMKYTSSTDNSIILSVPSNFYKDQIKVRYSSVLEKKLLELSGTKINLEFTIVQKIDNGKTAIPIREEIAPKMKETVITDSQLDEKPVKVEQQVKYQVDNPQHHQLKKEYTFENYVIGDNNSLPTNAGKAIVNNPGKDYNPCLIYGGVGLGKTHLMQAIGNGIHQRHPDMKIVYIPAETFINEFINSISTSTQSKFKSKYRKVDVLLIDDIHDLQNKTSTQEELFHTFNALYDSNKQLVFTCDRPPSELQKFSDRLKSRFERGLNVDLLPPDFETRVAILRKKLGVKNIDIPDEVLNFMSKNITTNIRDLEAALTKLIAYADLVGKKITMEVAKTQLKHVFQKPLQLNITIDKVQKVVSEYFNVTTIDLKSKKRTKIVTFPRQVAMYIIREITDFSTTEIGLEFGGRDHTTVMHACQKIEDMTTTNSTLEPTINNLIRTVKESGGN